MTNFTVYPAIDLRGGQVVRLTQGDPDRQTTYNPRPKAAAGRWIEAGARWLHVVNLDGAFGDASPANLQGLEEILQSALPAGVSVQFGGGVRDLQAVQRLLDLGVKRVILATAAARNPELVSQAVDEFGPDSIVVGVDVRENRVQVQGWTQATSFDPLDYGRLMSKLGARWAVHTDISRDGLESGLNVTAVREFQTASRLRTIAAGGVSSLEDIRKARREGLSGVITGRALYEENLDLTRALNSAGEEA